MIDKVVRALSIGVFSLSLWVSLPKPSPAQMGLSADDTLGSESTLINPVDSETFLIENGARRDGNLFHSFEEFNVEEGTGVYFVLENTTTNNIFSRVTSNGPSNILGTVGTCLAGGCNDTKTEVDPKD